jgi:hypothetical protein
MGFSRDGAGALRRLKASQCSSWASSQLFDAISSRYAAKPPSGVTVLAVPPLGAPPIVQ